MADKPETLSIEFELDKAGADAEALARELEEQIRSAAKGGVEVKLSPNEFGEAPIQLTIVFARSALSALTNAISQFRSRHATSQFKIASDQSEILIGPDMDSERIKAAIEKLAGLPSDPATDPPRPRKRVR